MDIGQNMTLIVGGVTIVGSALGITHSVYALRIVRRQLLDKSGTEGGPAEPHRILKPSIDEVVRFGGNPIGEYDAGDVSQVQRIRTPADVEATPKSNPGIAIRQFWAGAVQRFAVACKLVRAPGRFVRLPLTSSTDVTPSDVNVLASISTRLRWSIRVLAVALVVFLVALALR